MARTVKLSRQVGTGPMREFVVTLLDDPPERVEAFAFFSALERPIRPATALPPQIDSMSSEEAQSYLDMNPQRQLWSLLRVLPQDRVSDDDLRRLEFIPELLRIYLYDVGNDAIVHLKHLNNLLSLAVYSTAITDDCLSHLHGLKSLQTIDFQGSLNISGPAFSSLVKTLPSITNSYPPH